MRVFSVQIMSIIVTLSSRTYELYLIHMTSPDNCSVSKHCKIYPLMLSLIIKFRVTLTVSLRRNNHHLEYCVFFINIFSDKRTNTIRAKSAALLLIKQKSRTHCFPWSSISLRIKKNMGNFYKRKCQFSMA